MMAEMDDYIRGLKEVNDGQLIPVLKAYQGSRTVAFTGVLICNQTVREMYERLVENGPLKHLPTYLLSQDHLEAYFGQVSSSR